MKQIFSINNLEILHAHDEHAVTKDIIFFRNRHMHRLEIKTIMNLLDDEILDNYLFRKFIEQLLTKISFDIKTKTYDMLALYIKDNLLSKFANHIITIEIKEDDNTGYLFTWNEDLEIPLQ
jgi:hypothetical protein